MSDEKLLEHVALNPKVMVGKPVIKGTRLTVEYVLNLRAHGATFDGILGEYTNLTQEDLRACILFTTKSLEDVAFIHWLWKPRKCVSWWMSALVQW